MADRRPRLTTRSRATAEHIRDRRPFTTSGALSAQIVEGLSNWDSGRLYGADLDLFLEQCDSIEYVVYSYSTPIAWYWGLGARNGWHIVSQRFSPTTSKHQGNLYLIPQPTLEVCSEPEVPRWTGEGICRDHNRYRPCAECAECA